jgi:pilus assembly protein CpaE
VGATTIALYLALQATRGAHAPSVCLVDFDLPAGDVASMLDLNHRHSVMDLLEIAGDLSSRHLEGSLYVHQSGLRVLLAPPEGERYEDMDARAARAIVGAIKSRFDFVVVDCGATVTEANAVATEMADQALLVVTPDVPAMRAANRQLALWDRLHVRKAEDVTVVMNRVSKNNELQPDLARRVVGAPLTKTVIPAGFRALEAAINTGAPERTNDGPMLRAFASLAHELEFGERRRTRRSRAAKEAGQVAIEFVGLIGVILVLALLLWQIVLTGYTFVLAGHAAREGARQVAVGGDGRAAALRDLPSAWRDGADVKTDDKKAYVTVTLAVPVVIPGLNTSLRVPAGAGSVKEDAKS